ncbi:MAG: ABC transporter permease [Desulfurococcales archaeon]|nr:ABC transporter permease [Desulfurococcales archaeon]
MKLKGMTARVLYLLWKDLLLDYRNPYSLGTQAIFSLSAGVVSGLAARSSPWPPESLAPATLALVSLFNSVYASYSTFIREREQGTLEALQLIPGGPLALYASKLLYSAFIIASFNIVYILAYVLFSGASHVASLGVFEWALTASLFMAAVSSFSSAMLVYSSSYTTLAPLIVTALSLPYLDVALDSLAVLTQGYNPPSHWRVEMAAPAIAASLLGGVLASYVLES